MFYLLKYMFKRSRKNQFYILTFIVGLLGFKTLLETSNPNKEIQDTKRNVDTMLIHVQTQDESEQKQATFNERLEKLTKVGYPPPSCQNELNNAEQKIGYPLKDIWQTVKEGKMFVYSAFLDERPTDTNIIKIMGISRKSDIRRDIYCQLWFGDHGPPLILNGKTRLLPEQPGNLVYLAVEYQCRIKKLPNSIDNPKTVSIVTEQCDLPTVMMKLHINKDHPLLYNFTVCLCGPLKFGISNVFSFAEWIEMNGYFGADHYVLYNHSASDQLLPYVKYYAKSHYNVEMLQWKFPDSLERPFNNMKNFGHVGLVQDCLYRSMYNSRWVVFMDTDEFIVPRLPGIIKWEDLLEKIGCDDSDYLGIRNVFFKMEWPDDESLPLDDPAQKYQLITQIKTKREDKIWPHGSRSKYMVRPQTVDIAGIHEVHLFGNINQKCKATPDQALVHHYRDWEDPRPGWLVDRTMHRYRDNLINMVQNVHDKHLK